jgi:hypothetical protein
MTASGAEGRDYICNPPDPPLRTAEQMEIRALAGSEADLADQLITARQDAEVWRLIATQALSTLAATTRALAALRAYLAADDDEAPADSDASADIPF